MTMSQGKLWAALLLLSIALAAAHTSSALSPQPAPTGRGSSRPRPVPPQQPTPEELWDKAVRGLKSIDSTTLSPQPEPPGASGSLRYRHTQLVRKWQPAPEVPVKVYKPGSVALPVVRGLKAVALSPQPEPPGSRASQQAQRYARWAAVPLVKAPTATAPVAPRVASFTAGRGLKGIDAIKATDLKVRDLVDIGMLTDIAKNLGRNSSTSEAPSDPKKVLKDPAIWEGYKGFQPISPKPVKWSGDVERGFYDACNAGPKFKAISCDSWSSTPDLVWSSRRTSWLRATCDKDYIECGSGGEDHKREIYHIAFSDVHGTRSEDGQPAYYAHVEVVHDRFLLPTQRYCWKRVGASSDGSPTQCGCLCEIALKGSTLGRRPECRCEAV